MNRYLAILRITWQDSLAYRAEAIVWMLVDASPLVVMAAMWIAIYGGQAGGAVVVGGMDLRQMITYYALVTFLGILIGAHSDVSIIEQIRDGLIAPFLLRPLPHILFILLEDIGWKTLKTAVFLPVFGLALFWLRDYLTPPTDLAVLPALLVTVTLSYFLFFLITYLVGLCAFWMQEALSLAHVKDLLVMLLGGAMLPTSLLPDWMQALALMLPFRLIYAFPAAIYLRQVRGWDIVQGWAMQVAWIAAAYLVYRVMWRAGTRRFALVGG